ncbi:DUF2325 domain-containing protein|uniref:Dihydroorotate dehydrogenase n=1 Tax=Dendrosporobacter quercicolus TaxID=146817 RepID=A0A1G9RY81_9FIRM|nr:DUF2325 domain-containing protein [Dendrosporobacter quercicolus]NSL49527.1 DUF2325 domain-containing protein [Dendrosporobacter quercicolus DSM 1736]SDM28191.1 hypothetical protein SAMN04488502_103147 [Dendrosporobacter quercicolus]
MSVMLVGADHLGNIEKNLQLLGINAVEHVTGRKAANRRKTKIPISIALIVVFIDYVNHITTNNIKQVAKAQGVPLIFANRSWSSLQEKLANYHFKERGDCRLQ